MPQLISSGTTAEGAAYTIVREGNYFKSRVEYKGNVEETPKKLLHIYASQAAAWVEGASRRLKREYEKNI